jgi:hypothetical protein
MPPYIPPVVRFDQVRAAPIRWHWAPHLARDQPFLTGARAEMAEFRGRTPERAKQRFGIVAQPVRRGGGRRR